MPATNVLAALVLLFLLGVWSGSGLTAGADDDCNWCVGVLIILAIVTGLLVIYCFVLGLWPLGKLVWG